jgi:hypothetical protein
MTEPAQPPQPSPTEPPPAEPSADPKAGEGDLVPRTQVEDARREAMQSRVRVRELEDQQQRLSQRLQSAEDKDKTELEKEKARADRLERRLAHTEAQQHRHEVAADRQLPVELLAHVPGDRQALEQAADTINTHVKQAVDAAVKQAVEEAVKDARAPRRSSDPVARGAPVTEPVDMNEFIRAGFRR